MLTLKATLQPNGGGGAARDAEIDLDFVGKTWSIRNGRQLWPGVSAAESGSFVLQPWGVIWIQDGTRTPVILRSTPLSENDGTNVAGDGRVYEPESAALRDAQIKWTVLRRAPTPAPPGAGSPQSAVRRRVLAVCGEIYSQPNGTLVHFTSETRKPGSKVTNCGVFPGMVFGRVPVIPPYRHGAFKVSTSEGVLYLTSPTTAWELIAQTIDNQKNPPRKTWVPFTGGNRPIPGDIYLLKNATSEQFQHVGIVVSATGTDWVTADGGQGDGYEGGFVRRKFDSSGEMTGEFGNKARLKGWVDLDNLYAVAKSVFPQNM